MLKEIEKELGDTGKVITASVIKMKSRKFMPVTYLLKQLISEDGIVIWGHIPHWADCKFADDFRKNNLKDQN